MGFGVIGTLLLSPAKQSQSSVLAEQTPLNFCTNNEHLIIYLAAVVG